MTTKPEATSQIELKSQNILTDQRKDYKCVTHQNYSPILGMNFSLSGQVSNQGVLNKSSWVATILFQ